MAEGPQDQGIGAQALKWEHLRPTPPPLGPQVSYSTAPTLRVLVCEMEFIKFTAYESNWDNPHSLQLLLLIRMLLGRNTRGQHFRSLQRGQYNLYFQSYSQALLCFVGWIRSFILVPRRFANHRSRPKTLWVWQESSGLGSRPHSCR